MSWQRRPLLRALELLRQQLQEEVVPPIQYGALVDAETAAVALIRRRRVRVGLLLLQREAEEGPPHLDGPLHQATIYAVVHHLEESPLAARLRHRRRDAAVVVFQVDRWDGGGAVEAGRERGTVALRLDVVGGDGGEAALRQGLHSDDRLGPLHQLDASHGFRLNSGSTQSGPVWLLINDQSLAIYREGGVRQNGRACYIYN